MGTIAGGKEPPVTRKRYSRKLDEHVGDWPLVDELREIAGRKRVFRS
jgi:hypothetical protein